MKVRLTALDPNVWTKNGSNIQQVGIFNELNAGVFLINPAQIAALGGTKSSQLSDSDFLSLRLSPSLDATAPAASHLNSAWTSNGWTVDNLQTFLNELKNWCENHFGVSSINEISADVDLILMQGKISNDAENTYTVALAYFGDQGADIGVEQILPVPSPALWLKADALTGLSEGSDVATWTASAGNNATGPADSASRPKYHSVGINAMPSIYFDGGDHMTVLNSDVATAHTVFFVAKRTGNGAGDAWRTPLSYYQPSSADRGAVHYIKPSTGYTASYPHYPVGSWYDDYSPGIALDETYMVCLPFKTGVWTLYRNGSSENSATASTYQSDIAGLVIGGQVNPYRRFQGYVSEVIVYAGVLTQSEREKVEGYLAHKWGLAAKLPANHPYKSNPPGPYAPAVAATLESTGMVLRLRGDAQAGADGATVTSVSNEATGVPSPTINGTITVAGNAANGHKGFRMGSGIFAFPHASGSNSMFTSANMTLFLVIKNWSPNSNNTQNVTGWGQFVLAHSVPGDSGWPKWVPFSIAGNAPTRQAIWSYENYLSGAYQLTNVYVSTACPTGDGVYVISHDTAVGTSVYLNNTLLYTITNAKPDLRTLNASGNTVIGGVAENVSASYGNAGRVDGTICEIVSYDSALGTVTREAIVTALRSYYGI